MDIQGDPADFRDISLHRVWGELARAIEDAAHEAGDSVPVYLLKLLSKEHGLSYSNMLTRWPRYPRGQAKGRGQVGTGWRHPPSFTD